jgi:hypothetical protein
MYGLFGSVIGTVISLVLFIILSTGINNFFKPIVFFKPAFAPIILLLALQTTLGTFIGFVSSWFGVRRFIKY